jgi:hypothetical protein
MAQRGLICREPSYTGRYPDIVLTERGRAAITKAAPAHAANVRAWFIDALGPKRLARFAQDCETVCAALDEHEHEHERCPHNLDDVVALPDVGTGHTGNRDWSDRQGQLGEGSQDRLGNCCIEPKDVIATVQTSEAGSRLGDFCDDDTTGPGQR